MVLFRVFPLMPGSLPDLIPIPAAGTLGRSPVHGNAYVVSDLLVSRVHARLTPEEDCLRIQDLGSKNGTHVDGRPIKTATAGEGAVIRMGDTLFVVRELGLDTPAPERIPFVCFSLPFRRSLADCERFARSDLTVLLQGETGTGKEVLARWLHERSGRPGPMVPVNCATLAAGVFESALFGHKRGAFTGAVSDFGGQVRAAARGTLFLDEVGELATEVQAKLLRFLESREVATVGAAMPETVDVRVIAATNLDLAELAREGRFRPDLHARLAIGVVRIPPLRERPEDTALLAAGRVGGLRLTADAVEALLLHPWPYNVRELLSVMDNLRAGRAGPDTVGLLSLPRDVRACLESRRAGESDASPAPPASRENLAELLRACDGNVAEVARRLGKDRKQIYRWMAQDGIESEERTVRGKRLPREAEDGFSGR